MALFDASSALASSSVAFLVLVNALARSSSPWASEAARMISSCILKL